MTLFYQIVFVFLGGGIGSVLRFFMHLFCEKYDSSAFPFSTLLVNVIGSFMIGLLWGILENNASNDLLKAFLFVGILGGFTTFSAFSLQTMQLFVHKEYLTALGNILLNNIVGIGFCYLGYLLSK